MAVRTLGVPTVPSPLTGLLSARMSSVHYVHESDRVTGQPLRFG